MAAPPPKPKNETPEGLAEVERALSYLHGRHPEHERLRREDEEKTARRKAEIEAAAKAELSRSRVRRALFACGALCIAVLAMSGAMIFRNELARRGRIEQAADPYRALGFSLVEATGRSSPSKLEASVPAGCVLAASSASGVQLRIAHTGGAVEGVGPVLTCLCEGGNVTVTGDVKAGDGIVLVRIDANAFGGSRAFAFLPFKPGTTGRTDQACAEGTLDAWLDGKRWTQESPEGTARPLAPVDAATSERWLAADPKRASLAAAGFKVTSIVKPEAPFAIVQVPAEKCALVVGANKDDKVAFRTRGGALAVGPAPGSAGWCTSSETLVLAQREGSGEVAVLMAEAARVGGLQGVREAALSAGIDVGALSVSPKDRGWAAKQLLLASSIPETLITTANAPDLVPNPEARIVALSVDKPNSVTADTPPEVFSFCDPQPDTATSAICVFSGPQRWRVEHADAVAGLAFSKVPFWLFGLQSVSEPVALKMQTEFVGLARRLRRDGFEPTTIEAVTETDKGAEILGRANEDAIVAVGLAPTSPWFFPYTDGPAWSIEGEPRVIPIRPLERLTVTATIKRLPPKAERRTVVFRRHKP